jgi:hypothetical protein
LQSKSRENLLEESLKSASAEAEAARKEKNDVMLTHEKLYAERTKQLEEMKVYLANQNEEHHKIMCKQLEDDKCFAEFRKQIDSLQLGHLQLNSLRTENEALRTAYTDLQRKCVELETKDNESALYVLANKDKEIEGHMAEITRLAGAEREASDRLVVLAKIMGVLDPKGLEEAASFYTSIVASHQVQDSLKAYSEGNIPPAERAAMMFGITKLLRAGISRTAEKEGTDTVPEGSGNAPLVTEEERAFFYTNTNAEAVSRSQTAEIFKGIATDTFFHK